MIIENTQYDFQIISFSNNMEYEDADDDIAEEVKAGSFYTTPNDKYHLFSHSLEKISKSTIQNIN